jgi:hypothetical protein
MVMKALQVITNGISAPSKTNDLSRCCLARMMDRTCCATTESTYTCTQSCNLARARFGHSCTRQLIARVLINILRRIDILMQLSQTSHSVTVGVVALQKPLIQSCNEQVDTIRTCRPKNSVRCANKDSLYYVYIYIYIHMEISSPPCKLEAKHTASSQTSRTCFSATSKIKQGCGPAKQEAM